MMDENIYGLIKFYIFYVCKNLLEPQQHVLKEKKKKKVVFLPKFIS